MRPPRAPRLLQLAGLLLFLLPVTLTPNAPASRRSRRRAESLRRANAVVASSVRHAPASSAVGETAAVSQQRGQSFSAPAGAHRADSAVPRVSVVIPTYNEAKNLPLVFAQLPEELHEVIVVDGRSVDDTIEVARSLRPDVRIVLQNRVGKGNAMACGFAAATGDVLVMLDADGSADPNEIPRFVRALVEGADFAKGTRFAFGGGSSDITRLRAWGNRWLNRIANWLFGTRYTDLCYGYNAFWAHCLEPLGLDPQPELTDGKRWGDGFEIETIINTRVAKSRLRITEVPSFEHDRVFGQSNLNTWRDGVRVLRALAVERLNGQGRQYARRRPVPPQDVELWNPQRRPAQPVDEHRLPGPRTAKGRG